MLLIFAMITGVYKQEAILEVEIPKYQILLLLKHNYM